METFLKIDGVSKSYSTKKALNRLSFEVPRGQIFGLLGPNGAGKTTLIRIINRILTQDEGEIYFDGKPITSEALSQIGYMPEERGLYKKMKVGEQILFFARLKGLSKAEATKAADIWMKRLKISSWYNDKAETLSKGMQQKVQFIITVLHKPKLLIFDEPFTGFDPINADLIKKQILWLKEQGTTIIFSTHNMASVEEICDRIVLINKGENVLEGQLDEVKQKFFLQIYDVEIESELHELEQLETIKIIKKDKTLLGTKYTVKLVDTNKEDFLNFIVKNSKLLSFNPVVPKLHDIFVDVVEKSNNKNTEQ